MDTAVRASLALKAVPRNVRYLECYFGRVEAAHIFEN